MCTRIELDQILKKITDLYYYIWEWYLQYLLIWLLCKRGIWYWYSCYCKRWEKRTSGTPEKSMDAADDIGLDYEVIISPTVISYKEFEDYKNILPYYRNIVQEGVVLSGWLSKRINALSNPDGKGEISLCEGFGRGGCI